MTSPTINTIPIEIKKLGAVNHAKIKFKPLTVFVGENNTGKTYSAYLIGYVFSHYALFDFIRYYNTKSTKKFNEIEDLVETVSTKKTAIFNLKSFIEKNSEIYFNCICKEIVPQKFNNFLASDSSIFRNIKLKMDLEKTSDAQSLNFTNNSQEYSDFLNNYWKEKDLHVTINKKGFITITYDSKSNTDRETLKRILYFTIFQCLHRSIFNDVYFLGAERTGLTLFVHSTSTREEVPIEDEDYKKLTKKPKKDDFQLLLAPHVEEALSTFTSCYDTDTNEERQNKIKKNPGLKKFLKFAEILERRILGGKIKITENKSKKIKKVIFGYLEKEKIQLEMPISSSAVKGLSPLVLDLKYYVEPNELIIIDEPEMNLHPKAQAELIELLAMIVNAGVHIIITTHSPYIVDHLINLMKAEACKKPRKIVDLFYLKERDAFISKDNVSVYLFDKETHQVVDILDAQGKVDWNTFSKVAEDLMDIYFKIDDYAV